MVHADEQLMALLELEAAIRKKGVDTVCRRQPESPLR
jgi:hypothetical protein